MNSPEALQAEQAPQKISELPDGISVFNTLQSRDIWKKRPIAQGRSHDLSLLIDQAGNQTAFDGKNGIVRKPDLYQIPEYSGVVMVSDHLEPTQYREAMDMLTEASKLASPGTVIVLLEKKEEEAKSRKKWRDAVLNGVETDRKLVRRSVLNETSKEWTVWESQVAVLPADLVHEGPFWRRDRVKKMLQNHEADPSVVDYSAIYEKVLETENIPETIGALEHGFGIVNDDNCPNGVCQIEIGTDGSIFQLNSCDEEHIIATDQIEPREEEPIDTVYCWDHPGIKMPRNSNGQAICPHCIGKD